MSTVERAPSVRRATPEDAPALVTLVESAYRGERSRRGWTTEADLLDGQRVDLAMMRSLLADPDVVVLVAATDPPPNDPPAPSEQGGAELVGCCEVRRVGTTEAAFGMFAVDPDRQGAGVGDQLLGAAEQLAATELRARRMTMSVIDTRHELLAWYERRGYRRTDEHRPFPYGDERFGRPRRDDLRFEVLDKQLGAAPT
jgi:ribosomal protein S18 acetylase RimI-like enzyme